MQRRIVGIDLGIATDHTVVVLDEQGRQLARRRAEPTRTSLEALEVTALSGAAPGLRLEVVMEATGAAWLPVAVFFAERGHRVCRVSSQKASDLRRYFRRHHKSNRIDALTLARMALLEGEVLAEIELPRGEAARLDREVRVTERLTEELATRKTRIRELARQLMPTSGRAFSRQIARVDLELLRAYGDPRILAEMELAELTHFVEQVSHHMHGEAKAAAWLDAARAAVELFGSSDAVPFDALVEDLTTEIRLLEALEAARVPHERRREAAYRALDERGLARSLPGIGEKGAPLLVAVMGRPERFKSADRFCSFTGLAPKASETGETDRKSQAMTKAGNRKLRRCLYRAADTARKEDPQLARIYYTQMVERGAPHTKALAVVASHLARRAWRVLVERRPYELRDTDGRVVSKEEARTIIAERYTVTEEVRRRRRSKKTAASSPKVGKVPHQVLEGHDTQGARSAATRRPSPSTIVAAATG